MQAITSCTIYSTRFPSDGYDYRLKTSLIFFTLSFGSKFALSMPVRLVSFIFTTNCQL